MESSYSCSVDDVVDTSGRARLSDLIEDCADAAFAGDVQSHAVSVKILGANVPSGLDGLVDVLVHAEDGSYAKLDEGPGKVQTDAAS